MPQTFDYVSFFRNNRIAYREEPTRELLIKCPWCGTDDPSEHLSVNRDGKGFRCFRNDQHRGRNPARLVRILLRCSLERALSICGIRSLIPSGPSFLSEVKNLLRPSEETTPHGKPPRLPEEFLPLRAVPSAWPYLSYMKGRGYNLEATLQLAKKFDLYYCTEGPFRGRIIFLVKRHGKLLTWTGRTVLRDTIPRYRSHTTREELATKLSLDPAADSIARLLLWHDFLETSEANTLVVCEGPMDALKVNHFGLNQGIISTCLFTSSASSTQIDALAKAMARFRRTVILLDQGTLHNGVGISLKLGKGVELKQMPDHLKDPGNIATEEQLLQVLGS